MDLVKILIAIAVMAFVTAITRFFPFLFFRNRELPPLVLYVQKYTPPVIMTVLVIYCLYGVTWARPPHGIPEMAGIFTVAGLHIWKRNPLISIFGGTILYMVLVQTGLPSRLF